jgi:DNA-binding transcriptional regulator LsrR (DeoR family)
VLGLSWARSVSAMAGALRALAPVPVVQLTGALARPSGDDSSIELVREVARVAGGPAYYFYAPMAVPDAATAMALRGQPEVARAFGLIGSVTKAVAGVGAWEPEQSTLYDAIGDAERGELRRAGVCAEVSGVLIDTRGDPARATLTERMIGITAAQMRAVPEVIGIVYGVAKTRAVLAAVRGGYVDSLVTHSTLATALIEAVEVEKGQVVKAVPVQAAHIRTAPVEAAQERG